MQKLNENSEKFWVLFMPHDLDECSGCTEKFFKWILNRLHKNFSHVAVFKRSVATGMIIEINPCSTNLFIREHFIEDFFELMCRPNITSVVVKSQIAPIKAKGLITCVSITKSILGISKASIITPYQLYKFLKRNKSWEVKKQNLPHQHPITRL